MKTVAAEPGPGSDSVSLVLVAADVPEHVSAG